MTINTRFYLLEDTPHAYDENGKRIWDYYLYGLYASKKTMLRNMRSAFRYYTVDLENINLDIDDCGDRHISFDVKTTKGDKGVSNVNSYRFKYYKNCVNRLYIDVNYPSWTTYSQYRTAGGTITESYKIDEILNKFIKVHDSVWIAEKKPDFLDSEYRWG